jgi:hypothetical protein
VSLELLRELARADERYAEELASLADLGRRTAEIKVRAEALAGLLDVAPAQHERLAAAVAVAEAELAARQAAAAEAHAGLMEAQSRRDQSRLRDAQRAAVRAQDAVALASKRLGAAEVERDEQLARVEAARKEAPQIAVRAADLARELGERSRMPAGAVALAATDVRAVSDWASGARAALVVARSGAASERDGVTRQANEIASAMLGEPQQAAGVATVAARVERALAS